MGTIITILFLAMMVIATVGGLKMERDFWDYDIKEKNDTIS